MAKPRKQKLTIETIKADTTIQEEIKALLDTCPVAIQPEKKRSKQLETLLSQLHIDFGKLQSKVDAVFEQARKEGFTDKEIGKWIREEMKEEYGSTTICRVFERYPEARQKQNHTKKVSQNETFEQGIEDGTSDVPSAPDATSSANVTDSESVEPTPVVFQIKPEGYMPEDLEKYDKTLLIKIAKYLDRQNAVWQDECMKWDHQIHSLAIENKKLKEDYEVALKKIEAFRSENRALKDAIQQFNDNPKEYLRLQKMAHQLLGSLS